MIPILLQIAAILGVAAYLYSRWASLRRRQAESWDSLVARLQPGWGGHLLTEPPLSGGRRRNFAPRMGWRQVREARGLWSMFENAGVMLEMADFAARNGDAVDGELLEAIRRDAMSIRVEVLSAFARLAVSAVNEGIWTSVLRAESAYAEMELRMTEILQTNAAQVVPSFVAAM